jgi:uncharacterized protein YfbU (UPF0304 family)
VQAESVQTQLSREQRLILVNQYRILERVDPEQGEDYAQAIKVLEHGWELNYQELADNIFDKTMSAEACIEVLEILDMFRCLEQSYRKLEDKGAVEEAHITFAGFDGNYETAQLVYADFVINDQHKFQELADHGDALDSHFPHLHS